MHPKGKLKVEAEYFNTFPFPAQFSQNAPNLYCTQNQCLNKPGTKDRGWSSPCLMAVWHRSGKASYRAASTPLHHITSSGYLEGF